MQKVDVSIIIVFFDGWENLKTCLSSIASQKTHYTFETIIVNNGNEDIQKNLARTRLPTHYIKSHKNLGYGAGNNLGIRKARGKYLFILNPDTRIAQNTIEVLVQFLITHKNFAIIAPNLLQTNGKPFPIMGARDLTPLAGLVAHSFLNSIFPKNPVSNYYFMKDLAKTELREASAVPGSAFMITKNIFKKVGMFDENLFLYYEESDLGKRIRDSDYKLGITPDTHVFHKHSTHNNPALKKVNQVSRFYYFKKHYGIFWAFVVESFARFSKKKFVLVVAIGIAVLLVIYL
jgi:O-antigen biosynthesis protein